MCSSTLSLTLALDGVGCQHHALAAFPLYKRLGGPQGWSGQVQKILPPLGYDSVQHVASHYTNYTIMAHRLMSLPSLDLTAFMGNTLHTWNHQ